jgi:hypothetical protein
LGERLDLRGERGQAEGAAAGVDGVDAEGVVDERNADDVNGPRAGGDDLVGVEGG